MNSPIYNPNVPYVGIVPGGVLQPGALIRIQGTAHVGARCFAVNLQCGPNTSPRDDVALHLSPVFSPPPRVVRNSIQQHQWGPEESHGPPFPFVAGQGFEMLVLAEQNRYKIAINGAHYTEFNHRIPLHRVTHISIDGEVSIIMLAFEGTAASSAPPMPAAPVAAASMPGASLPPYPISGGDMAMPSPMSMPVPDSGRTSPYGGDPPMPPLGPQYGVAPAPYPQQPGYGAGYPHGPPAGTYPGGYPAASYPGPGVQHVAHPGGHKHGSGMGAGLGTGLAAGAAALAGGSFLKHGMSHGHKSHKSSPIPISGNLGKGLAVGAGALAGAALLKHANPLKAKKMKKIFKHKHKHGWGGWSSSSSSSSSEEE